MSVPRRALRGGLVAVLLLTAAAPAAARALPPDTTLLSFGIGPAFDAHTDLLASPFRQSGTGYAVSVGARRGPLSLELVGASVGTSSSLTGRDAGLEDGWTAGLDLVWLHPIARGGGTAWRVGGSLAGLAFVRRHHYGRGAAREYFADLMLPLSVVAEVTHRFGGTRVEERMELGLATVLFRSPYAATKTTPAASFAAPGAFWLVRHRLGAAWRMSPRASFLITHEACLYQTERQRLVRVIQQRLATGVALAVGGAR